MTDEKIRLLEEMIDCQDQKYNILNERVSNMFNALMALGDTVETIGKAVGLSNDTSAIDDGGSDKVN